MKYIYIITAAAIAFTVASCGGPAPKNPSAGPREATATTSEKPQGEVTKEEVGAGWPFAVDSGRVACINGLAYTFAAPDGIVYALNGPAQARAASMGWININDAEGFWLDNPNIPGAKIPLSEILNRARNNC